MFHIDDALAHLASPAPSFLAPQGAPMHELTRSRAAAAVGQLASRAGLFLAHYEHRVRMPLPEHWCEGRDEVPQWVDGVLPEPKYAAFRHELPIGSFHPGHRAKWTAHELCHRLVGFSWQPGQSPLLTATASRLAELLPVVLWYFLDEVGLARCPLHSAAPGSPLRMDPLFRASCPECEQIARTGPLPLRPELAEPLLRDAISFVEAELAAIARTRERGQPVPHVWGSLDLCSDGVAYARGHHRRLRSVAFERFAERFLQREGHCLWWPTLEGLEQRVIDVLRAIATGTELELAGDSARWAAWDLAGRLLEVWEQCEGEAADELLAQVDRLAPAGTEPRPFREVYERYVALHEAYDVPSPEEVFGVGYALEDLPCRSARQVAQGLETVTPLVQMLAHDAGVDLVAPFVEEDAPERAPLGVRFAAWLQRRHPGPLAELARYEASLRAASADATALALGPEGEGLRLLPGAQAHVYPFDVVRFAERVDSGERSGRAEGGTVAVDAQGEEDEEASPMGLVVARDAQNELVIAEIEPGHVPLLSSDPKALPEEVRDELVQLGLLVPVRWSL